MVKWKRWAVIIALVAIVVLIGAYFGGLLEIVGPSGSIKAWSYETDVSQTSFDVNGLSQAFVPTTSISNTTSVYVLLHASEVRYGTYNIQWSIDCNGVGDSGGAGHYVLDTTTIIQTWVPLAVDAPFYGNMSKGDSCILYVDVFPMVQKGGTGTLSASDIAWRSGGNVQPCPTCPAEHIYDTIVWGTPAGAPPASPTLKTSFTYTVSGFTAVFQTHTSGGQGPYTYHWAFGDGKYLNETKNAYEIETVTHTYPAANGTYKVTMYVSDSTGVSPTQTASLTFAKTITTPPCGVNCQGTSTTAEAIPSWVWIVLAVAAAAIVLVFVLRRRM